MIFTIGYGSLRSPNDLVRLLSICAVRTGECSLGDVRSSARTRKKGFGGGQLAKLLGDRYIAMPQLGGRNPITHKAITSTLDPYSEHSDTERSVLLMCQEAEPIECHRHYEIAMRVSWFVEDVIHLRLSGDRFECAVATEYQAEICEGNEPSWIPA